MGMCLPLLVKRFLAALDTIRWTVKLGKASSTRSVLGWLPGADKKGDGYIGFAATPVGTYLRPRWKNRVEPSDDCSVQLRRATPKTAGVAIVGRGCTA